MLLNDPNPIFEHHTLIPATLIDLADRRIKRKPILGGLINEDEAA